MKNLPLTLSLPLFAIIAAAAIGWVLNIIKLAALLLGPDLAANVGITVFRAIALFIAPVGAVLGWF